MADTEEDGQTEPRRGKMTSTESKPKFKDPLMNTADGDSDDGEVKLIFIVALRPTLQMNFVVVMLIVPLR